MIHIVGTIGDTAYNLMFATHILAVVAAFGPTLVYTMLGREAARREAEVGAVLAAISPLLNKRVSLPALAIVAFSGVGLIIQSDEAYTFDKPWISAAFSIVLVLALLAWFVLGPSLKRLEQAIINKGDNKDEIRTARATAAMATGLFHLSLIVLVVLMVWKPGQ